MPLEVLGHDFSLAFISNTLAQATHPSHGCLLSQLLPHSNNKINPLSASFSASSYLPFSHLDVFHGFKFTTIPLSDGALEHDSVKAKPAIGPQPAWFDTAVVLQGDDAEATGLQGKLLVTTQ